jgi:hypothetical protein
MNYISQKYLPLSKRIDTSTENIVIVIIKKIVLRESGTKVINTLNTATANYFLSFPVVLESA